MEIAPGVHRIEGVVGSNAVLLADEQMALIDTGIPGNGDTVVSYIKSLGRSPRDLRWIIATHHHFDHSGSAMELHELTGGKVLAHQAETETGTDGTRWLRKGIEGEQVPGWYRLFFRGRRPSQQPVRFPDTQVHETVEDGTVIPCMEGLRVLHAPGHTPGSICLLLEGPQVLFLGDSLINNVTRLSRPLTWDRSKRRQLEASLRNLRDLAAETACFGHGPPLSEAVMERIHALTEQPYDLPTWLIVLKNWRTLRRFAASTRRPGHWQGGQR